MKSICFGLPAISPITKARSRQRMPSSSANRASPASRARTWTTRWRKSRGSPGRYGRPPSRIAARSCTQRKQRSSSISGGMSGGMREICAASPGQTRGAPSASAMAMAVPAASSPAAKMSPAPRNGDPGCHASSRRACAAGTMPPCPSHRAGARCAAGNSPAVGAPGAAEGPFPPLGKAAGSVMRIASGTIFVLIMF